MKTLVFKVIPWADPMAWRKIELTSVQSLFDLHEAIVEVFDYESDHLHSFYLNAHLRDRVFAYGDSRSGRRSSAASFRELEPLLNKSWMYLYDFRVDHIHNVQLVARGEVESGESYPRVLSGEGDLEAEPEEAPPLSTKAAARLAELVPELRRAVKGFNDRLDEEQERGFDFKPLESAQLKREHALGLELLELCGSNDWKLLGHLTRALDFLVDGWLRKLPGLLGDAELYSLAVELSEKLLLLGEAKLLHIQLPFLLLGKGDEEAALARIDKNLEQYPQDYEVLCSAGSDFMRLDAPKRAEKCFREALFWAGTDWQFRETTTDALIDLLEEQGREQDIDQLRESEAIFEQQGRGVTALVGGPRLQPHGKKVGRNDPCPCASGKKYKKCCGKAA